MPKYPAVSDLKIKKSGIFDFDTVYKFIYQWLAKHKYDFHEDLYKHKPGFTYGNEIEISISGMKKITEYYQNTISIEIHMWDVMDVPVVKDGKKKVMTKNRMTLTINTDLVTDYEGTWETTKLRTQLRGLFEKYIIKKNIEDRYVYELYKETYQLVSAIKEFLDMETMSHG